MVRKFVTGAAQNVVVTQKKQQTNVDCQGCGTTIVIMTPHAGEILCPKCMQSKGYILKTED